MVAAAPQAAPQQRRIEAGGAAYFSTLWLLGFRLKDFTKKGRT